MSTFIGIDVAKHELVACLMKPDQSLENKTVANTSAGHQDLVKWARKGREDLDLRFCMESTGCYHMEFANYLLDAGLYVSVVEPRRIKYFGVGLGMHSKTDKADAKVIARYAQVQNPKEWSLADPVRTEVNELIKRVEQITKLKNQENNRLENKRLPKLILAQINENVERFQDQINQIQMAIEELLPKSKEMEIVVKTVQRVKGIGLKTALAFAAIVDPLALDDAKQVGAIAGVDPALKQSGTMLGKTRISKKGNAFLRTAFYYPALTAIRHEPVIKEFAEKLTARGLTKKEVIVACIRKLLMICYGIAKNALLGKPIYGILDSDA